MNLINLVIAGLLVLAGLTLYKKRQMRKEAQKRQREMYCVAPSNPPPEEWPFVDLEALDEAMANASPPES